MSEKEQGHDSLGFNEGEEQILEKLLKGLNVEGDEWEERSESSSELSSSMEGVIEGSPEGGSDLAEGTKEVDFDKAKPQVHYERPKLKTDKRMRVTQEGIDKLFKDLDMTLAGGNPPEGMEQLGKDLEGDMKVADLPELSEEVAGAKEAEAKEGNELEKEIDLEDVAVVESVSDDSDAEDSSYEESLGGGLLGESEGGEEREAEENAQEENAQKDKKEFVDIGWPEGGVEGGVEGEAEQLTRGSEGLEERQDIKNDELSEELIGESLNDIDEAILEEDVDEPKLDLKEVMKYDKEEDVRAGVYEDYEEREKGEEKDKTDDLVDFEENIKLSEQEAISSGLTEDINEEAEDILINEETSESDSEYVKSEFTSLKEFEDYEDIALDEGRDGESSVNEEEGVEESTDLGTGEIELKEELEITKDVDRISEFESSIRSQGEGVEDAEELKEEELREEVSSLEEAEELIKSVSEPTLNVEEATKDIGEIYKEELREESVENIKASKEYPVVDAEQDEIIELKGDEASLSEIELPDESVPTKSVREEAEPETGLAFTEEDIETIQKNISTFPPILASVTKDTIINERLPKEDLDELTHLIITNPDIVIIKDYLENKRNIKIDIKEKKVKRLERAQDISERPSLTKLIASILLLAGLIIPLWLFILKPYMESESKYKEGITDIKKGTNYYEEAINKFLIAKGDTEGNRKWYIKYAKAFMEENNPQAYYYAHIFLAGDEELNKQFLQKYKTMNREGNSFQRNRSQRNRSQNDMRKWKPGQSKQNKKKIDKSKTSDKHNNLEKGVLNYLPNDKEAHLLLGEVYKKKALWAAYNASTINGQYNFDDVEYYLSQALYRAYKPLLDKDQLDIEVLDNEARTYILWTKLLHELNPQKSSNKNLTRAENNFNKILTIDSQSPKGLYGLLYINLTKIDLTKDVKSKEKLKELIRAIDYSIERAEIDYIDEKILSEYGYYLLMDGQTKKAKKILNNVIRNGKIYPKSYYYLGLLYEEERDLEKSIESYVKGLFAYYYIKLGEEQFFKRISNLSGITNQKHMMDEEMQRAIISIRKDTDPLNKQLQSAFFNKIGENILTRASYLSNNIEEEKLAKERIIKIAEKSFQLAIEKDIKNHLPWENLGNIVYGKTMQATSDFIKNLSKGQIIKYNNLTQLKDSTQFKKAKYYYSNALNLMIDKRMKYYKDNKLWKNLVQAVRSNKIAPDLFYKIGYILYRENKYKNASEVWHSIKTIPAMKFNPSLNFALANSYIRLGDHLEARRHYKNIIDFYEPLAHKYRNNPDPTNLKQNHIFAKLTQSHNNLGVSYHIMSEKLGNYQLKEYARLHYFQAREYASRLNNSVLVAKELWNQNILNNNYVALQNASISLKKRLKAQSKRQKTLNPLDYMLIEDIEFVLK